MAEMVREGGGKIKRDDGLTGCPISAGSADVAAAIEKASAPK